MHRRTLEKLSRLKNYPLFVKCGVPVPDAPLQVGSWTEATRHCKSRTWDGCLMMAHNALLTLAHQRQWERGNEWNDLVTEIRSQVVDWLNPQLASVIQEQRLPTPVVDSVRWYLMHICLEVEYQDVVPPLFYLPLIDPWLQRGHFPCGWVGDEFPDGWEGVLPQGKLVVF
jgi:hypothetical protein